MKKLMIIDGNSIVNRAFYGVRALTNAEGLQTNAIYGFLNIMFRYLDEESPDYLCVAFDLRAPTFRHKMYDQYKAQRKGMPEELACQMPVLKEVLSAMNIDMLSLEGYEADDIIGTVSRKCDEADMKCIILTGDKDDLQLATKNTVIKLITTGGNGTNTVDYDETAVFEKYGVTPAEFIEVKGLMGDSSDNIPGVAGIGEKTAIDLIVKYKSIENIYRDFENIELKPAVRKKLEEGRDNAFLSRTLSEIDKFVPIREDILDFGVKEYNNEVLVPLLKRLNFQSFLKRFEINDKFLKAKNVESDDKSTIKNIKSEGKMFFYEKNGEIAISSSADDIAVTDIETFKTLIGDNEILKCGYNLKETAVTYKTYVNAGFDVMVAGYLTDATLGNFSLESIALRYLTETPGTDVADGLATVIALCDTLSEKIKENEQEYLYYDVELPLTQVLADMQLCGVKADVENLKEFSEKLGIAIEILSRSIYTLAGVEFNINSPKQLGEVLFEKLLLPSGKKTKSGYSTSADVLEKLRGTHEIIDLILEYRQLVKLKGTYADGLLNVIDEKTGKIHSSFNQTVTVTGRISSTEPNLQNIPVRTELGREVRKMFTASDDNHILVDADYSQIELRVLAHIADDEKMIYAFKNDADIHTSTATQIFGVSEDDVTSDMRSKAKTINFGLIYGMSEFTLAKDLHIKRAEAKKYIENYFDNFSGVKEYMDGIVEKAKADGFVKTVFNRKRLLPELTASNFMTRSFGERVAMNTPIQGTAADIIKIAMVRVHKRLKDEKLNSKLILQVHDELIIDAQKEELSKVKEILLYEMENAVELSVPLKADMNEGETWYEAK